MKPFGGEVLAIVPSISGDTPNAPDLIGSNDGTLNGGVSYVRARDDFGAVGHWDFDGAGSTRIETGGVDVLPFSSGDLTLSVWAYLRANRNFPMFATWNGVFGVVDLRCNAETLQPQFRNRATITSNETIDLNRWYHFAGVQDGLNLRLYVNGVEKASDVVAVNEFTNPEPIVLGNRSDLVYATDVLIDDARLFNRGLAASEIKALASRHAYQRRVRDVA